MRHDHRAVFQRHYGDLNAAIAAIPGNTSANTLWLLDHLPKMSPKVIVLQIGANDQRCRWGPEITAQNIRAIISRAKQKWPMARIVLVPPLPRGSDPGAERGEYVSQQFAARPDVRIVWLGDLFVSGGKLVGFDSSANLHPTAASQDRMGARLGPVLHDELGAANQGGRGRGRIDRREEHTH
ncbi:SGNH/GDSL hydrolase family protein [Phenylobacterium sp. LjRoot219]|uniref:SGNH/GDSL hydrolase family protein n=1 Tax=Phenylobacterium sp. LjRoot219 TaxID=3342283 RepID=UPI003F4FF603